MSSAKRIVEKDWFWIAFLSLVLILIFGRLLFTDQIIRASDVLTQLFWSVKDMNQGSFLHYLASLPDNFHANWDLLDNGGRAGEGGGNALNLLFWRPLVYQYFPFPASIAWLAVLSLLWGGIGTYYYCRQIGVSRFGSFAAGLLFAYCSENATLINAGHTQKIETISWFPWVLLYLEKALATRRFYHYAVCVLLLAIQFFCMHWQISFYSCIVVALYWLFMTCANYRKGGRSGKELAKDVALGIAIPVLFFTTVGMSLVPTMHWAQQSERSGAVTSGAATGEGGASARKGIGYEEGMSWSMPPEEVLTYFVPGLVGYSRQEAGDVPKPGQVFYWGRMHFTQTTDYLGLLPWLLLPFCFVFRRDRYTWFYASLMALVLFMALGKYTFVYRFMFDYLPGFATFRVPKMILFVFAFGAAVLTGRGLDLLAERGEERGRLRKTLFGLGGVAGALAVFALVLQLSGATVLSWASGVIDEPTRYQSDPSLIGERYSNMVRESWLAFGMCCAYLALLVAWFRRLVPVKVLLGALLVLLMIDLWRVNDGFFLTCPPPATDKRKDKTDVVSFLEQNIGTYRMQPIGGREPFYYSGYKLPNISAYVTISERRYKEFLDVFQLVGTMPDLFNLKYLVLPGSEYATQKAVLGAKWEPVYTSPVTGEVVVQNRNVLPKVWLVPSVVQVNDPQQRLAIMSSDPRFNPATLALVESPPPIPMAPFVSRPAMGVATLESYEANRVVARTRAGENTLLVLGDKYYPSWRAELDGKPVEVQPVDHILRGVYVPAGEHRVVFEFHSSSFETGKYLTLGSFVFFAGLFLREALVRRREKRAA